MNNIINYNYKLVNIVWNDRGIKILILYNILKYYNKIKYKNIIIENKDYRIFAKKMFPELKIIKFNKYKIDYKNNFYFNIRKKLVKKDIFIDYLYNYNDKKIPTKNVYVIPWFDINDTIISFRYTRKTVLDFYDEYNKIIYFANNFRSYNNKLWDNIVEFNVLNRYKIVNYIININLVYIKFFNLLKKYYREIQQSYIFDNNKEIESFKINDNDKEIESSKINDNNKEIIKFISNQNIKELINNLNKKFKLLYKN